MVLCGYLAIYCLELSTDNVLDTVVGSCVYFENSSAQSTCV